MCQMRMKKRKFDTPFDTDFEKALYTNAFLNFNRGFDSRTVTMTENTLELVSRVFLLVLLLYSENSELFRSKIFLRNLDF